MDADLKTEIAATAARLVVDEGMEYGPAKRRALKLLGLPPRTALPDNHQVEDEVRTHIALFCADTQPGELLALRQTAAVWMARLAVFRPTIGGAVWHGTATRLSDIHLQLFTDDSKAVDIALIDMGLAYEPRQVSGFRGEPVEALSLRIPCRALGETVGLHLMVYDYDDFRGALQPDARGRTPRGGLAALQALIAAPESEHP